ncbi:hypothetical protein Aperf_G00000012091 [Anoplocephala perfoliata]
MENVSEGLEDLILNFQFLSRHSALRRPVAPIPSSFSLPPPRKTKISVPKLKSVTLSSIEGCLHEVILPVGVDRFEPLAPVSRNPAKTYPFQLDPFQREANLCIENDQSVLVSAHTSAGKTVVAEYAIARCLANNQRVIYTTPIKALSNQKFWEFKNEFKDVGLMTGDITIKPEAALLIMTTEILRLMLYRGNEVIRKLGWVIFDEIHYMREKERGVVWEESIILLPDRVRQVFLSATIPNARQFAEWVAFLHKLPCHVVYADYRPIPLEYFVSPCGGDGLFLILDESRKFNESNFNEALDIVEKPAFNMKSDAVMRTLHCSRLIKWVMDNDLLPLIVFSFSKKDCQYHANKLPNIEFTNEREKAAVDAIISSALESLSVEDREIPQIDEMLPFLRRGIGVHHGGLLPILRELIEILFSEGYLKILFATETFAMGLNMPARTVIFKTAYKFDCQTYRHLSSGEYIQMSGRAGRRGKDDRGTVILMIDKTMTPEIAKRLLLGDPDPLNSAFTFSYNSVLNWLSVGNVNPQKMLEKSFLQFQNYASIPALEQKIASLDSEFRAIDLPQDIDIRQLSSLLQLRRAVDDLERQKWQLSMKYKHVGPFLTPGRILRVESDAGIDFGWAIVLNVRHSVRLGGELGRFFSDIVLVDVLVRVAVENADDFTKPPLVNPAPLELASFKPIDEYGILSTEKKTFESHSDVGCASGSLRTAMATIASVPLDFLHKLSMICLDFKTIPGIDPKNSKVLVDEIAKLPPALRLKFWEEIEQVKAEWEGCLPLLDPVEDLGIEDAELKTCLHNIHLFDARIADHALSKRNDIDQLLHSHEKRIIKYQELRAAHKELDRRESLLQLDELHSRKRVLRQLGFCTDVIQLRGRIAREISYGDELMLTELLFDGFFGDFTPAQIAGVLSCFVPERGGAKKPPELSPDMEAALKTIRSKAREIGTVIEECRVNPSAVSDSVADPTKGDSNTCAGGGRSTVESYVNRFTGDFMEVVRSWAEGISFAKLLEKSEIFAGSLIRCLRLLDGLLRQMHSAAKVIGDGDLEIKFAAASYLIRRDIVFAESLYLLKNLRSSA